LFPALAERVDSLTSRKTFVSHWAVSGSGMFHKPGIIDVWHVKPGQPLNQNIKLLLAKTKTMLASASCPDTLRWAITDQGYKDGANLGKWPLEYVMFPDSLVVTAADSVLDLAGNIVTFPAPRGFVNPGNIQNVYTNYENLFGLLRTEFGSRLGILMIETGVWANITLAEKNGVRQAPGIQRLFVKNHKAIGWRIWLLRGTLTLPLADGTHFTGAGYNTLGERAARVIADNLVD
jgi:hypothetical protein